MVSYVFVGGNEGVQQNWQRYKGEPAKVTGSSPNSWVSIFLSILLQLLDYFEANCIVICGGVCRFVVKTVDEGGRKVFINVCGSDKVAAPASWVEGEVKSILAPKPDLQAEVPHTWDQY